MYNQICFETFSLNDNIRGIFEIYVVINFVYPYNYNFMKYRCVASGCWRGFVIIEAESR